MKTQRSFMKLIWWSYVLLLLALVVMKFRGSFAALGARIEATPFGTNYNLLPFSTIRECLTHFSAGWARYNFFGNIIPFLPFGFLLPLAYQKADSWSKVIATGGLFILCIELFQFFTRLGSFDVDDILLNMLSIACGYLIKRLITHEKSCQAEKPEI